MANIRARANSQKSHKGQNAQNGNTRVCEKCVASAHWYCLVAGGILLVLLIVFFTLWRTAASECTDNRLQNGTLSRKDGRFLSREDRRFLSREDGRFLFREDERPLSPEDERTLSPEDERPLSPEDEISSSPDYERSLSPESRRSLSREDERCLVNDAKKGLECMGCNAPTLMKLPMSRDLLKHFIPDVVHVALLGCLNATSYCQDPHLECCPDEASKVSRNISLAGTYKHVHKKRHYEIFEFTKCKCQPRDKCIRYEEVTGKFVREEYV